VNVTGIVTGLVAAVEELTLIFPWYVPGPRPAGLTVTETVAGATVPMVPTESQASPEFFAVIVCPVG